MKPIKRLNPRDRHQMGTKKSSLATSKNALWAIPALATLFLSDPVFSQVIDWDKETWPTGSTSKTFSNIGCPGNQKDVTFTFSGSDLDPTSPSIQSNIGPTAAPDGKSLLFLMAGGNRNRTTTLNITFSSPVVLGKLRVHDIDTRESRVTGETTATSLSRLWVDEVEISGNSGSVIPTLAPDRTVNAPPIPAPPYNPPTIFNQPPNPFPYRTLPLQADRIRNESAVVINPNFPAGNVATGVGEALAQDGSNATAEGSITADFGINALSSIQLIYRNAAISPATGTGLATVKQGISIGDLDFANPCIGVAKQAGPVTETVAGSGIYTIPYTLTVRNQGNKDLTNVQVTENFASQFGLALGTAPLQPGQYRITAGPTAAAPLTPNPGFNGSTDTNILNAANSTLARDQTQTITLTVEVRPPSNTPILLNNQVTANAAYTPPNGSPITVTDKSNNGPNPPTGNPGAPGGDTPTQVAIPPGSSIPQIGVAKASSAPQPVAGQPGVFDITYTLVVQNEGNEALNNVQVVENFAGILQPANAPDPIWSSLAYTNSTSPLIGQYTIVTPPTVGGSLTVPNGGFTGSGAAPGINLLGGGNTLAVGASGTITFTARVRPNPSLLPGNLNNQVAASGTGATSGQPTTDLSVNGANPDANGNARSNDDTGPTPAPLPGVAQPDLPKLGVAKVVGLARDIGNGIYEVPYTIRVQNYGGARLTNIQVEENFAGPIPPSNQVDPGWSSLGYTPNANPGSGQYTVISTTATGSLSGNGTFTGSTSGSINLLNPAGSSLDIGQSETINFVVRVHPANLPVTLNNQVRASGIDPNNPNTPVTDDSTFDPNDPSSTNPDTNGNGNPNDDTRPTPLLLPPIPTPLIGVGKSATNAIDATPADPNDGLFNITYAISVRNAGNVDLTNVQLADDFASQFDLMYVPGAPGVGQYTIIAPPSTSAPLTANGSFTGSDANTGLLNAAGSTLAIGQSQILTVGVQVNLDPVNFPFLLDNQVKGTGTGGGQEVSDLSNDGTNGQTPNNPNPDPDGDGDPTNNNIPTRVALPLNQPIPRIGTSKDAPDTAPPIVDLGDGRYNVPYTIVVENAGTDDLNNVQVTENFEAADPLGFGLTYTAGTPARGQFTLVGTPSTSNPLRINPTFTGSPSGSINLLDAANSTLPIGQRREINFVVQVFPTSIRAILNNRAQATGTGVQSQERVADDSVDDLSTTPGNSLNPNNYTRSTQVELPPRSLSTGGNFVLVKRITNVTRNGQAIAGLDFTTFTDDPSDANDNTLNNTSLKPVGLLEVQGLQSGDEVEYTVYYLAAGNQPVANARVCDLVPERTTFIPNSFGGDSGILLRQGTAETSQTNSADGDNGQFFSPLAPVNSIIPPCPTGTTNPNGAVFSKLGNIPNSGPNQTGFMRFRVRID
ncbi:DUF11 domain-containing protein [Oscillatoria sp. FACHB-1406]|uniref:DUF7507 domain-containing protein n=1 Tax=Oscillatoria sp. FACHB-1406 TaxID=2692846 RepID=UPI001683D44E|nr:DUF11 domain-containing protein [Oscillatoria sp. FACHB-1406]MBD2577136.1 hypothetical protein [Oscillatoria sp. FACHB-1406]